MVNVGAGFPVQTVSCLAANGSHFSAVRGSLVAHRHSLHASRKSSPLLAHITLMMDFTPQLDLTLSIYHREIESKGLVDSCPG